MARLKLSLVSSTGGRLHPLRRPLSARILLGLSFHKLRSTSNPDQPPTMTGTHSLNSKTSTFLYFSLLLSTLIYRLSTLLHPLPSIGFYSVNSSRPYNASSRIAAPPKCHSLSML